MAGDVHSQAHDINDAGQIIGISYPLAQVIPSTDFRGVLWQNGMPMELGDLGGDSTWPTSINSHGQVVGAARNHQGQVRAFIWEGGEMQDLNCLVYEKAGWILLEALEIDDDGLVAGSGELDGELAGYVVCLQCCTVLPTGSGHVHALEEGEDVDGDGLLDEWERCGWNYSEPQSADPPPDVGGQIDLVFPRARVGVKDLYVEVDAMEGCATANAVAALGDVVAAFAAAEPEGIALHFVGTDATGLPCDPCFDDVDATSEPEWPIDPKVAAVAFKNNYFGSKGERASNASETLAAKRETFKYGMVINRLSSSDPLSDRTGLASTPGRNFIVALPRDEGYTRDEYAAVIMHELGHTLALLHGGRAVGEDILDDNYAYNYRPNSHS